LTEEQIEQNAKYAISISRKLGATVFLVWEDIRDMKIKMLTTFLAAIMDVYNLEMALKNKKKNIVEDENQAEAEQKVEDVVVEPEQKVEDVVVEPEQKVEDVVVEPEQKVEEVVEKAEQKVEEVVEKVEEVVAEPEQKVEEVVAESEKKAPSGFEDAII
jgi:F0F1-type ATP synthase membrane subunit b/b'